MPVTKPNEEEDWQFSEKAGDRRPAGLVDLGAWQLLKVGGCRREGWVEGRAREIAPWDHGSQ